MADSRKPSICPTRPKIRPPTPASSCAARISRSPPALQTAAEEKASRLLRHEEHIIRIRLDIEHDRTRNPDHAFVAKGHIEIRGSALIASAESDEPQTALDALIDKLDALLRKRSSAAKSKRHHPHGVELPSDLPKVD
jgi:putative sigma-54 modulation protein